MGDMTIRGLDEATLTTLRLRAEEHGMSPEGYAALLLRGALGSSEHQQQGSEPGRESDERDGAGDIFAEARRIRAMTLKPSSVDSTKLIRESRDEW